MTILAANVAFKEPLVNTTLEMFVQILRDYFGERLATVILYGSICFDDLAPGYGDLDFLAVMGDDLSDADRRWLVELRHELRSGRYGPYAHMLEGAFLPQAMLNPTRRGCGFWWGTTRERPWERNELGPLVLHVIREAGQVIWGRDLRSEIPPSAPREIHEDIWKFCRDLRAHGRPGDMHAVDWLLSAARLIRFLREGALCSKTAAARWGAQHIAARWAERLGSAERLRLKPARATDPYWRDWLAELSPDIAAAGEDLERELAACGFVAKA